MSRLAACPSHTVVQSSARHINRLGVASSSSPAAAAALCCGGGVAARRSNAAHAQQPQHQPQPHQRHRRRTPASPPRAALREETPEQARERRLRESARVEERVDEVDSVEGFRAALEAAGSKLVVLEVQAEGVCMTGLEEEPELHWKQDREAALTPCTSIKHTFQRTARECPDVLFLSLQADSSDGAQELADELGVDVLPTLQFWRNGAKLWEHKGVLNMDQDLGEGVLYFNGSAANGMQAGEHVTELSDADAVARFVNEQPPETLAVVAVCAPDAAPCIHVFPAVVALARSFKGYAAFGRVMADASAPAGAAVLSAHNVVEVPTFLFFRGGQEVGRHVGSSRGDLIGRIMEVQSRFGVAPPPPPGSGGDGSGSGGGRRVIQRRVNRRPRAAPAP